MRALYHGLCIHYHAVLDFNGQFPRGPCTGFRLWPPSAFAAAGDAVALRVLTLFNFRGKKYDIQLRCSPHNSTLAAHRTDSKLDSMGKLLMSTTYNVAIKFISLARKWTNLFSFAFENMHKTQSDVTLGRHICIYINEEAIFTKRKKKGCRKLREIVSVWEWGWEIWTVPDALRETRILCGKEEGGWLITGRHLFILLLYNSVRELGLPPTLLEHPFGENLASVMGWRERTRKRERERDCVWQR